MRSERSRNAVVRCTPDTGWNGLAETLATAHTALCCYFAMSGAVGVFGLRTTLSRIDIARGCALHTDSAAKG